ncbi:MAG: cyclic nucleotide-binding domain-containing protein [Thermoanaerobaculia bacterium]|nr:cyclic nucleotide-binding domain-containing protein [Thermoanaerobaculia bacterium]
MIFRRRSGAVGSGGLGRLYQDGEAIVRQGEIGSSMFVIQAGRVGINVESEQGSKLLRHLGPGDCFGELALFDEDVRSATVRAEGDARVLTLDKRTLLRRFYEDPSLAYRVVKTLATRVRQLTDELTEARRASAVEQEERDGVG